MDWKMFSYWDNCKHWWFKWPKEFVLHLNGQELPPNFALLSKDHTTEIQFQFHQNSCQPLQLVWANCPGPRKEIFAIASASASTPTEWVPVLGNRIKGRYGIIIITTSQLKAALEKKKTESLLCFFFFWCLKDTDMEPKYQTIVISQNKCSPYF